MSAWVDVDVICDTCGYNGKHLQVDDMLVCGRCDLTINDE